ncbi:MAG: thioredoxin family protein [Thiobacillaceae bacterium]
MTRFLILSLLTLFAASSPPVLAQGEKTGSVGTYYGAQASEYPAWFKESFLILGEDVREAAHNGKRVMLLFYQDNCPYCAALVERNLSQRDIESTLRAKFDVIALNIWGDREVMGMDGMGYTEKSWAATMKVQFTPTLLFLDEGGKVVLRLNGYVPPARMKAAIDWVAGRMESKVAFRDYLARQEADKAVKSATGLIPQPFFLKGVNDLRRKGANARPLAVFFEQKDCPDCEVMHRRVIADPEVKRALAKFDNVQFDMWSRDSVTTPEGRRMRVRDWVRELGVNYAPSIVLFSPEGKEVIRWEASFRVFHTMGMFDYVSSQAYLKEPSFQRYLAGLTEHIRREGRDVNIYRYADEPMTAPVRHR